MRYTRYRYWIDWLTPEGEWTKIVYLTGDQKGNTRYWSSAPEAVSQAVSVYKVPRGCQLLVHPEAIIDASPAGPAHKAGSPPPS